MRRWFEDVRVVERLAAEVRSFLSEIRGCGRFLATRDRPESLSEREWLAHYGRATKLSFFPVDIEAARAALMNDHDRLFLRGPAGLVLRDELWSRATSSDKGERSKAAASFRVLAEAIDPAAHVGRPTELDSRRIRVLYRMHRRLCSQVYQLRERFITAPPTWLLPVIEAGDGDFLTPMDKEWIVASPKAFLSASLDVKSDALEYHIKRGRAAG